MLNAPKTQWDQTLSSLIFGEGTNNGRTNNGTNGVNGRNGINNGNLTPDRVLMGEDELGLGGGSGGGNMTIEQLEQQLFGDQGRRTSEFPGGITFPQHSPLPSSTFNPVSGGGGGRGVMNVGGQGGQGGVGNGRSGVGEFLQRQRENYLQAWITN